ncbi:MAG: helix-turn-helix domain-containing protein, partial [Coriobacteriales bacterium]|nr:helix-turn-helix domain-containing protein [Coriobacteriales bacterium]
MRLSNDLAQPIVDRLCGVLDCPISITDAQGIIIASTEDWRLGIRHEAAVEAIATQNKLSISEERASDYSHTFEGVTLPLVLYDSCAGALCLRGKPEKLEVYASIISIAVISLLETAEITHQVSTHQRLVDTWVKNLISASDKDLEQNAVQAHILGIDCQKLSMILAVCFPAISYADLPAVEAAIGEVAKAGPGMQFLSYTGQGQFVCAIPVSDTNDESALRAICEALAHRLASTRMLFHIGVGRPNRGIGGYRQSYQDAFHSARVAQRLGDARRILYYNEQHIFRLLEGVPDYLREIFIANQTEGRDWDPILLETLQTYFAMDCRVNETARALYIHRNTLLFRLNKIA